jgi:signal transduction histidine kinase
MIALELGGWLAASAGAVAAAGARRALAGRMESVARACHELRGPLTAVRLGLEGGAGTGALTPDRLRAIDLELGRAALVLDDLDAVRTRRAWSRLPEPIDLEQLVSDSVEAWRPTAAVHGVDLRATWSGDPRIVWGDRLRLAQVTGNLIANAIEHGGGVVEVHGHGDRTKARVEVADSGPGLPAPVAELVRAGSRGRGGRGRRGRGLAIAAAVAADQGGRLAVAPSVRGARVVLELPAGRVPAGQGPAEQGPAGQGLGAGPLAAGGEGSEPPESPKSPA